MAGEIVELYSPERLARLEKRCRVVKDLLWALGLGVMAACVVLTAGVNTRNVQDRLKLCIGLSVGAAWIIVYFSTFVVRNGRRELEHAGHLREGPRQTVTGRVTLLKLKVQIRDSVALRKLRVEVQGGEPVTLNVHLDKAERLPHRGELLRLYTVHGYVVAYEVLKP